MRLVARVTPPLPPVGLLSGFLVGSLVGTFFFSLGLPGLGPFKDGPFLTGPLPPGTGPLGIGVPLRLHSL